VLQIRLATRGSRLALAQSGLVADALRALGADVHLVRVQTLGDLSDAPLSSMGGVGVFVNAVQEAVLSGDCDLAVHSMKDLPTTSAEGLTIAAIPAREDPRDALCARDGLTLHGLPGAASVGTGSPRRAAQLSALRPDLRIVDIRGNVETRLGRIGVDLDAVVLAVAGLNRIARSDAITEILDPDVLVPAPAQGALAVECRTDDHALRDLLGHLDHPATRAAVEAERAVMRLVEAGCSAPFGASARLDGDQLAVTARLAGAAGMRTATLAGPAREAERLTRSLADRVAPLRGLRVLMPPSRLADALRAEGVAVTTVALTETKPLDPAPLVHALADPPEAIAFTSARTIEVLTAAGIELSQLIPEGTAVAAVGPSTAAAVVAAGLRVPLVPASGSGGAALAEAFGDGPGRVLIPGAAEPAPGLAEGLTARGWTVTEIGVYVTEPATSVPADVINEWPDGYDAFVVTAPSVAAAAHELLGPGPRVVALGTTSASAASSLGFDVVAVATDATPSGLVEALATLRKESR